MARNYDRLIKYYDSWFDDLLDQDKGFSMEEIGIVLVTIRKCQHDMSVEPLKTLPKAIKRGLSMATLSEQILRICERTQACIERGAKGGNKAATRTSRENEQRTKINAIRTDWMRRRAAEQGLSVEEWFDRVNQDKSLLHDLYLNHNECKASDYKAFVRFYFVDPKNYNSLNTSEGVA